MLRAAIIIKGEQIEEALKRSLDIDVGVYSADFDELSHSLCLFVTGEDEDILRLSGIESSGVLLADTLVEA